MNQGILPSSLHLVNQVPNILEVFIQKSDRRLKGDVDGNKKRQNPCR